MEKKEFLPYRDSKSDSSVFHPVASHYTDYALFKIFLVCTFPINVVSYRCYIVTYPKPEKTVFAIERNAIETNWHCYRSLSLITYNRKFW
jgi:hypothetical protein